MLKTCKGRYSSLLGILLLLPVNNTYMPLRKTIVLS